MLVYGDAERRADAAFALRELKQSLNEFGDGASASEGGYRVLLAAGEFVQAVVDREFFRSHEEPPLAFSEPCLRLLRACAALCVSASGNNVAERLLAVSRALECLPSACREGELVMRVPEGFAHYAVYPELYVAAAERLKASRTEPWLVIGIRSIGLTLSAAVAAALGTDKHFCVRPTGHPFSRTIESGSELSARVREQAEGATCVIVDEGPGLSGSSFFAVYSWLISLGVPRERIVFMPSHMNDLGIMAAPEHRETWRSVARTSVSFEEWFLDSRSRRLAHWFGADGAELEDVSGGVWRNRFGSNPAFAPPSFRAQERRKFVFRRSGKLKLAKFAGLAAHGTWKLKKAELLAQKGLGISPDGLRHGFLICDFHTDARPLSARDAALDPELIATLARYIAALEGFEAKGRTGASPDELFEMALHNTSEALGQSAGVELERIKGALPKIRAAHKPVLSDNRMHSWEWLKLANGSLVKTDALDHAAAHDLIGPQDIVWDFVAACVEFELSETARADLAERLASASSYRPDLERDEFYEICYLAFQLGHYTMAADADAEEREKLSLRSRFYKAALRKKLETWR